MARRKYYKLKAGEWITPVRLGYRLMCCGCGLTHTMDHRKKGQFIQMRFFLDKRATANARRKKQEFVRG